MFVLRIILGFDGSKCVNNIFLTWTNIMRKNFMGWWGGGGGGDGTVSGSHQPKQIMEGDNDTVRVYQKFFFGQIRKIVPGKIRRRERKKEKQFRRSFTFGTKPSSFYKMNIIVFFYNSFFPISLQKKHSYGIKICFFSPKENSNVPSWRENLCEPYCLPEKY